MFLSIEDETGVSNAVVMPDVFERERGTLLGNSYLMVEGELQNMENVVTVRAARFQPLPTWGDIPGGTCRPGGWSRGRRQMRFRRKR